jgi:hypothetical protein
MEARRVIVVFLSLAFILFRPSVSPLARPLAQAQPQPGFVYVTLSDVAQVWKVNTASGEKSLVYDFSDPGFRAEDAVLDDYGILYIGGPGVGVKRIDTISGIRLPDVGINIQCPEGLSVGLSGSGDIYTNTRGSGYGCGAASGVWRIPGGTAQTAVQAAPNYSSFGEGTAFLRMPPFRGQLAIVDKTNHRVLRSSPADLDANNPPAPWRPWPEG